MDEKIVDNTCNPRLTNGCTDYLGESTVTETFTSQHSWGKVFRAGASYTVGMEVSFEGFGGASQSVTVSEEQEKSTGGFYETSQEVSFTQKCSAKPMTRVTCQFLAYKGTIEVGYTIYWKNGGKTRGTYRGKGWKSALNQSTVNI